MSTDQQAPMSFGDIKTASRMRSIMESIATGVVTRLRPDSRIGRVHHYDSGLQFAWVLFPGETIDSLVKVRIALDQTPTRDIVTYGDDADVVRVLGRPGNYWITDFVSGLPQSPHLKPGSLIRYGGTTTPDGFLDCLGTEALQSKYPALYAAIGTNYGTASAGNFKLPYYHKQYTDVDQITTGLFTANTGFSISSQSLRVRNSMVYVQVVFSATANITLGNVDHSDQVAVNPTAAVANYVPDLQAQCVAANAIRSITMTPTGNIRLTAGVVSAGSALSGNIFSGDLYNASFFYPMPDDVPGVNGERMIIKT